MNFARREDRSDPDRSAVGPGLRHWEGDRGSEPLSTIFERVHNAWLNRCLKCLWRPFHD